MRVRLDAIQEVIVIYAWVCLSGRMWNEDEVSYDNSEDENKFKRVIPFSMIFMKIIFIP